MSAGTIQQAFDLAVQHHQAGQLREAEALYRQILAQRPGHADALHLLGVLAAQTGRNDLAVDLIRQAVGFKSNFPEAFNNLGHILRAMGRLDEAIGACQQAIALNRHYPEACNNLGAALKSQGQLDDAIRAYRQALALNPSFSQAHNNLGNALKDRGELDAAIAAFRKSISLDPTQAVTYVNLGIALSEKGQWDDGIAACRQALALRPQYPEAFCLLGALFRNTGRLDEAIAAFHHALALQPNLPETHNNLGNTLRDAGRLDEAGAAYRQALTLRPNFPEAYNNLGILLKDRAQLAEAIAACRQALALQPAYAEAHNNLGVTLQEAGRFDEAIDAYRQAIGLKPNYADAHYSLALLLLQQGDFAAGWKEYEWRRRDENVPIPRLTLAQPQWDGSAIAHRTILLHHEQGFGDTLQFVRYVPLVVERGAKVFIGCAPELRRLLEGTPGVTRWLDWNEPLPPFDVHCPLMSLPLTFGTTLQSIPRSVPYVYPDAAMVEGWRKDLARDTNRFKVGLVWAGNPAHHNDLNRSLPLASLAPLAQVSGVSFYSLQKGAAGQQAKDPPPSLRIIDHTSALNDFADTAALISNLDLVIAVDTAVAHLAGALGKPVWTMLPFMPDWRWMLDREDSPWYPTMRLFRQLSIGDWASVIRQVTTALHDLVQR